MPQDSYLIVWLLIPKRHSKSFYQEFAIPNKWNHSSNTLTSPLDYFPGTKSIAEMRSLFREAPQATHLITHFVRFHSQNRIEKHAFAQACSQVSYKIATLQRQYWIHKTPHIQRRYWPNSFVKPPSETSYLLPLGPTRNANQGPKTQYGSTTRCCSRIQDTTNVKRTQSIEI
jgi:hypothetical protein